MNTPYDEWKDGFREGFVCGFEGGRKDKSVIETVRSVMNDLEAEGHKPAMMWARLKVRLFGLTE